MSEQNQAEPQNSPAKTINRNALGLIEGVDYFFNDEGFIDWRKMVSQEHLVPNRQKTQETDISKLEDKDLLILLGGLKSLAKTRGFTEVTYDVTCPSQDYVVAVCKIKWIPNYETENREVVFSAIGDASPNNTNAFGRFYLAPIAENRAFVRCVRNFLRINIVSQEELGKVGVTDESKDVGEGLSGPHGLLEKIMSEKGISFEKIKSKLIKENIEGADSFQSISDIPKIKIFELIERLKQAK